MIEVIAIGDEILAGQIVNTNSQKISEVLFYEGFAVVRQSVLSDEEKMLYEGLQEALGRADCVITTGGLGPTCDDHTRQVLAELFEDRVEIRPDLVEKLKGYFGEHVTIADQATVPTKAMLLDNPAGTASGLVLQEGSRLLIALPGVPREMLPMLRNEVIPFLKQTLKSARKEKERLFFCHIVEADVDPFIRELQKKYPTVAFGIYPSYGTISVHLTGDFRAAKRELLEQFGSYQYEAFNGHIDEAVHQLMIENKWTLSVAESCTGGSLASVLTNHPGSSQYFLGGVVAYSNAIKQKFLDVETVEKYGAVSKETVSEMVTELLMKTKSDWALAVSGIAGPDGGTEEKPVGTVWYALCRQGEEPHVWQRHLHGTRDVIIATSVNILLSELYLKAKNG